MATMKPYGRSSSIRTILAWLALLLAVKTGAQPVIETASLRSNEVHFITDVAVRQDEQRLSFKDIQAFGDQGFHAWTSGRPLNLGFTTKYIWLRFRLSNLDSIPRTLKLVIGDFLVYDMELYAVSDSGSYRSLGKTGRNYRVTDRPYLSNYFIYPLEQAPETVTTYYLFLDSRGVNLQVMLLLMSDETLHVRERKLFLFLGVFAGILLLTALFNLFLFTTNQERIHLAYALYSLSVTALLFVYEGFDHLIFFSPYPYVAARSTISCITLFLLLWVMQLFLRQNRTNSRWHRGVNLTRWCCILLPLTGAMLSGIRDSLPFWVHRLYLWSYAGLVVIALTLVVASSLEKLRQGFLLALFYLSAVSVVILAAGSMALGILLGYYYLSLPPNLLEIGMVLEALIICFGILYRYILYRKEREKLARDLQAERLAVRENLITLQEEERTRIARDLHDDLGSSLAVLKLKLQQAEWTSTDRQEILRIIDKASADTRSISHDLMPPEFQQTGLVALLSNYFRRLNSETPVHFQFVCSGQGPGFDKRKELMIYRIVMELVTNILRHSGATEATLQLIHYSNSLEVMAEDNGKGFDPTSVNGIGMKNIRFRLDYLGGTMKIDSGSRGTTTMIRIPYHSTLNHDPIDYRG